MLDWFSASAIGSPLPTDAATALREQGFVMVPGPVPSALFDSFARAYDSAVDSATDSDVRIGTTSTRVTDFVNRGEAFDCLYVFLPLLQACRRVIGQSFKLSSLHSRTLHARTPAQELHVDVPRESRDWPLVGFILMVDEFRADNGATRFVPGSHRWVSGPETVLSDLRADYPGQVLACGNAGSLLIFHGSMWHGHTANTSNRPRRSLQGAFIPQGGKGATDFSACMSPETRRRLSPLALQLTSSRPEPSKPL